MNNLVNFKSFFNFLGRNKAYTAIDLFGLSVSLMFVILIATYVTGELSTDRYHEKGDRIYALSDGEEGGSAFEIGYRLEERYPEIEKTCHIMTRIFGYMPVEVANEKYMAELMLADTTFFDFFSFPFVRGSKEQVFAAKNYAVISESFAARVFGNEDPMGKTIRVNDELSVIVNGVIKDIRHSVISNNDIICRVDNIRAVGQNMFDNYNSAGAVNVFVMEREGADISSKAEDIRDWFKTFFWVYEREMSTRVEFVPLKQLYFSHLKSSPGLEQGNREFVIILLSVGLLILLFAIINYVNLTVAQTGFRAKEMATRRLLGSSRSELFSRLIMESTLLTAISFCLGLFLAFLFAPYAGELVQKQILLSEMFTPLNGIIVILLIAFIGFMAGLLPAIVISNAKPIDVVRGTFRKQTKMVFSKFFIIFQNTITICLIAASLTMYLQINHLVKAPLGYNTANIIDINGPTLQDKQLCRTLSNELQQLAGVSRIGLGEGIPFDRGMNFSARIDDKNISFQEFSGDQTYWDMLGFETLRENHVADPVKYYLSEETMRVLELPEDVSTYKYRGWKDVPVAGIIRDFQLSNILANKQPIVVMLYSNREDLHPRNILVEVKGDPFAIRNEVAAVFEKLTGVAFEGKFIDERIEQSFIEQQRTLKIVSIFSIIAILISLLGLLAMSTYFIQQRSSEIAVRKVFGSTNTQVLIRLQKAFLTYVGVAFIIAIPLIWHFVNGWLTGYSYRIALSPWIYAVAGLFCLIISFVTVFVQSYQAATSNPVEHIKDN